MTLRERLRAILAERGPLTAKQLADIVDRASSQVRELLNDDARRGRIVKIPPRRTAATTASCTGPRTTPSAKRSWPRK